MRHLFKRIAHAFVNVPFDPVWYEAGDPAPLSGPAPTIRLRPYVDARDPTPRPAEPAKREAADEDPLAELENVSFLRPQGLAG